MTKLPNPDYLKKMLHDVTPTKPNGRDPGLDPHIARMVDFLDRAIRTQDPTIGTVVAAVGVLLGRKAMNHDNLERLIYDVTTAVRVGFYLHLAQNKEK
jgi:hypothetical protein